MSMIHEITSGQRHKRSQRKGRGESSGRGKTSGRGNKGSGARVGTYIRRGYEGGQTEIHKRMPKRGFSNNNFERRFHIVNLADLAEKFDDGATVDAAALIEAGLVPDAKQPVKILGDGDFSKKLNITAGWYSKSALEKITKAGGQALNLKGEAFETPKPKAVFVKRDKAPKKKAEEAPEGEEKKPSKKKAEEAPAAEEKKAE
jgi:large subunit ribosomal protein L15